VQQLGRADAIENVDAETRLPAWRPIPQRLAARCRRANAVPRGSFFTVSSLSIAENSVAPRRRCRAELVQQRKHIAALAARNEHGVAPTDIGNVSALRA